MNIAWKYLDKRRGAAQAVRDYGSMQFILENTDDEIKKAYNGMAHLGSPGIDGMPHAHDPKAGEARLVAGIEEIDVLKERYRQAMEFMGWFSPAWEELSEDDKYVLKTFYDEKERRRFTIDDIAAYFSIERDSVYRRKNRALDRLTVRLYGKT